jgi:hypothetical protein
MLLGSLLLPVAVAAALPPYVVEELPARNPPVVAKMKSSYGEGRVGVERIRAALEDASTSQAERHRALRALRLYGTEAEPLLDRLIAKHGGDPVWARDIMSDCLFWYANAKYLSYLLRCLEAEDDDVGTVSASCLGVRMFDCDRHFRYGPESRDTYDTSGGVAHVEMVSRLRMGDRDKVLDAVQRVLERKDISERRRKTCDSLAKVITDQMAEEQAEVTKRLAAKAARAAQDAATRAANGE